MDYGKLAYVKAEEVERYIRKKAAAETEEKCVSAVCFPHAELYYGYTPVRIMGSKSVGVMAALKVSAVSSTVENKITVECGSKLCATTRVTLAGGEEKRFSLYFSAYPGSGEDVRIFSEGGGLILEEANFLVVGAGAKIITSSVMSRADFRNGDIYVACEREGYTELTNATTGKSVSVAHGSTFDLSVHDSGISVIVSDDNGNMQGVLYDFSLGELSRKYFDTRMEKIAVGRSVGGLVLAGIRGGKIYLSYCDKDFSGWTDWEETDFVSSALDVYFSKQTDYATLFIRKSDGLYCKLAVPECGSHGSLTLALTATFI